MKVLVLAGLSKSLIHFRKELLIRLVEKGHQVVAVGPEADYSEELNQIGVKFVQLKFNRLTVNPIADLILLIQLIRLMLTEKPDVYFGYTIKPVIYGSIAACLARVKKRYAMVTGLGSVFIESANKKRYVKDIAKILYKMALKCDHVVFFQNKDDINEFVQLKLVEEEKCSLVNGSGVNLEYYFPTTMPPKNVFLFVGSVMGDKGVREYMKAASIVKKKRPDVSCWIVGPLDNRLTGITESEMKPFIDDGSIEYFGAVEDVRPYLDECRFYVLPSYREGTPRSVLEAMAKGRPIITTNAPGCRETVVEGINGFLVPIKDHMMLAERMLFMVENPGDAEQMAMESLRIVKEKYDVNLVNKYLLEKMELETAIR